VKKENKEKKAASSGPKRLCWHCSQLAFDTGHGAYSEQTPGCDANIWCRKGHDSISFSQGMSEDDFRKFIRRAETCEDFEEAKD
jgi:hypothetical protein